jgi:hypothetical protein
MSQKYLGIVLCAICKGASGTPHKSPSFSLTFHKGMSYVSAGLGIARMEALAALGRMILCQGGDHRRGALVITFLRRLALWRTGR